MNIQGTREFAEMSMIERKLYKKKSSFIGESGALI